MSSNVQVAEVEFILPDILAEWPWKRVINQHSSPELEAESLEWIQSFVSTPHMQRVFSIGKFSLLCFLAYPLESKDVLRVACDFTNLLFLLDEHSDSMTTLQEAQKFAAVVMDTVCNPDKTRPAHEGVFGEGLRQVWKAISRVASVAARGRLIKSLESCMNAIVQEVQDRALDHVRDIGEYLPLRRETLGAKLAFSVLEFQLNLPGKVFEDPVIQRLTDACLDLIILSNLIPNFNQDIYSYNVEQAHGIGGHNIVTVLMKHKHFTLAETMAWISRYASITVDSFLDDLKHVPYYGEECQANVERYLHGMANWVRASDCWSFESGRYFGIHGPEIERSRKVVLLPQ
ncbi:hypothetical protein C0992_009726 [Termitomyces sp. T32_za158]|nr:hypothetical protein C0992_009726 [Termitomyces sp. T32_za158]